MILRKLYIYLAIVTILAISPLTVFAALTENKIEKSLVITNAITSGDALYVVHYRIVYDPIPAATVAEMSDLYTGTLRIVESDGSTESAPNATGGVIYQDIQPENGFGEGLWGIYFTVDPNTAAVAAGGYTKICNEVVPGGSSLATTSKCVDRDSATEYDGDEADEVDDFQAMLLKFAEDLEDNWDDEAGNDPVDLISDIAGFKRLTSAGDDYFSHAIPNVRAIVPKMFTSGLSSAKIILDEDRDTAYETERANYFQGTELDTTDGSGSALDLIGDVVGLDDNPQLVGTAMVLLAGMAIAFFVIQATQNTSVGIFCIILVLQVGAFLGLVSFAVTAVLALIGALALGYIFFYKSSTS